MPTQLSLEDHLAALVNSGTALRDAAASAGLEAPVPTCPPWDVRALVTHLGTVHRWTVATMHGKSGHRLRDWEPEAAAATDLLAWFSDGVDKLVETIRATPDDDPTPPFLDDAPPWRRFWGRRHAHENTIHRVDAVGAAVKAWPTAADVPVSSTLAADGIDELLCGFITRSNSNLRSPEPLTLVVATDDTGHAWTVRIGESSVATTIGTVADADARFTGSAAQLYVGLWNRGDEITVAGRDDLLPLWRELARV
jgi:uncharacterized protein (TIGR03083 family)